MSRTGRVCGFTLIELLVALVIFGIFSVMAYAGLNRLLDGRARLLDEQRIWRDLSQVFMRISDDLAHARVRGVRDEGGFPLPAFVGRPYDPRALADPSLELTRGGELHYGEGVYSDLRRVAYRLRDGKLIRITWPVLDRAPNSVLLEAPLLGNVEVFELRFVGQGGDAGPDWPGSGANDSLPQAVTVTLEVKGTGRFQRQFLVNR